VTVRSALRRLDVPTVRAAVWAGWSLRRVRRALPNQGLDTRVAPPPPLPPHAIRGVNGLLSRVAGPTCLERSLILQAWLASHGERYPIAVGVAVEDSFEAHAWLEGYDAPAERFSVLTRVEARPGA
jgi:hypothetical protein